MRDCGLSVGTFSQNLLVVADCSLDNLKLSASI